MALKIKWTKGARINFNKILEYLQTHFGYKVASAFAKKTYGIIENLSEFPEMGTMEVKRRKIRGFLITKHNRVFYRYSKSELVVLNFFDTRKNPKKRRY